MARFLRDDISQKINTKSKKSELNSYDSDYESDHKPIRKSKSDIDKKEPSIFETAWADYKLIIGVIILIITLAILVWVFFTYKPKEDQRKLQDASAGIEQRQIDDQDEYDEMLRHEQQMQKDIPQPPVTVQPPPMSHPFNGPQLTSSEREKIETVPVVPVVPYPPYDGPIKTDALPEVIVPPYVQPSAVVPVVQADAPKVVQFIDHPPEVVQMPQNSPHVEYNIPTPMTGKFNIE